MDNTNILWICFYVVTFLKRKCWEGYERYSKTEEDEYTRKKNYNLQNKIVVEDGSLKLKD